MFKVNVRFPRMSVSVINSLSTACFKQHLSHDRASGSDIAPCNKIDKPLVVYRFSLAK